MSATSSKIGPKIGIVGLSGSFSSPSKTRALAEEAVRRAATRFDKSAEVYDLGQLGHELGHARSFADLGEEARRIVDQIVQAKALVIASPVYKGSYPGLFKHLFDLIDPTWLAGKPILLAATGGGEKHALIIEHQLRPLFAFFEAQTLATGVYVSERDFADGRIVNQAVLDRLDRAVEQFGPYLREPRQQERSLAPVSHLRLHQEALAAGF
ncbi:FMN reductase [Rhizobium sp. C4]|uniref:FMN reductase n=1 Tax=Rhizobium sp. C4 TaxID=1349800 RepID=UPI001E36CE96|nr:FMN reductase [Rhizobium sp. C4]MCD2172477.1 FMN reductase [Rhizobium sp. C4]